MLGWSKVIDGMNRLSAVTHGGPSPHLLSVGVEIHAPPDCSKFVGVVCPHTSDPEPVQAATLPDLRSALGRFNIVASLRLQAGSQAAIHAEALFRWAVDEALAAAQAAAA